jgi:HK97 family phage major capsid protein
MKRYGKLRAFRDEATAERAGMWAMAALLGFDQAKKWCDKRGIDYAVVSKDASEGVATAGGFLVPSDLGDAIIDRREKYGVFRATAQRAPMAGDVRDWPATGSGVTAYWVDEGSALTASQAQLNSIGLNAHKMAVLVKTSTELEEDSAIGLGDWLADEMAAAFARKEDDVGFYGDGTSTYAGFQGLCPRLLSIAGASKVVAATGHDTFAELDAYDLNKLMAALPASAMPGARWYVSQYGFATTLGRVSSSFGGIYAAPDSEGVVRPHLGAWPVMLTQVLPAVATDLSGSVMLAFGDMRRAAALGERRGLGVARSDAGPSFPVEQVWFKGTERVAINVHDLGDATTAGSIVGLVGE